VPPLSEFGDAVCTDAAIGHALDPITTSLICYYRSASFLILIARFATLDAWSVKASRSKSLKASRSKSLKASHPCTTLTIVVSSAIRLAGD
jgi:hypothetical protein